MEVLMMNVRINLRIHQLRAMHELMINCNDEEIYAEWIEFFPDEPTEWQLESIAIEDELYNEIFKIFISLISSEGFKY